jgi:hypothetical protein
VNEDVEDAINLKNSKLNVIMSHRSETGQKARRESL